MQKDILVVMCVFFFKQKTAYEMLSGDWSSDVCSSDLTRFAARIHHIASGLERRGVVATYELHDRLLANAASRRRYDRARPALDATQERIVAQLRADGYATVPLAELVPDTSVWDNLESDADRFVAETAA